MSPLTVVFVCTGNTCRSPLAMSLARRLWPQGALFLSAGLQALAGQAASAAAQAVAGERGLVLTDHRARALDDALVAQADWLIGMTRGHAAALKARLGGRDRVKIGLLGCPNQDLAARPIPEAEEVADPFGGDLDVYRSTADQLARLLRAWQPQLAGAGGDAT